MAHNLVWKFSIRFRQDLAKGITGWYLTIEFSQASGTLSGDIRTCACRSGLDEA